MNSRDDALLKSSALLFTDSANTAQLGIVSLIVCSALVSLARSTLVVTLLAMILTLLSGTDRFLSLGALCRTDCLRESCGVENATRDPSPCCSRDPPDNTWHEDVTAAREGKAGGLDANADLEGVKDGGRSLPIDDG